jgi:hypothetical protein
VLELDIVKEGEDVDGNEAEPEEVPPTMVEDGVLERDGDVEAEGEGDGVKEGDGEWLTVALGFTEEETAKEGEGEDETAIDGEGVSEKEAIELMDKMAALEKLWKGDSVIVVDMLGEGELEEDIKVVADEASVAEKNRLCEV